MQALICCGGGGGQFNSIQFNHASAHDDESGSGAYASPQRYAPHQRLHECQLQGPCHQSGPGLGGAAEETIATGQSSRRRRCHCDGHSASQHRVGRHTRPVLREPFPGA